MLALLVPVLALFPVAHSAPTRQDFKEPIKINLNRNNQTFPNLVWADISDYLDTDDKQNMRTRIPNPVNDTVGILSLMSTKDVRNISWTKEILHDPARQCTISLTGNPQTPFIDVDLANEKVADNQIDTAKLLKIDCRKAPASTPLTTAATAISTQAKETSVPFKTPLLVTLLAKPDHVDHSLIYDGLRLDIGNGGIHDGSYDSPSPEDVLLNPTNDTQVRLNWIKIQGTTDQERHYNWTGKSDDGPVVKQVIADLNVSEALIWVDSGEVKLGDEALNRQSFFHYCNTTVQDGKVTGPDGKVIQPNSSVIPQ